MPPPVDGLKSCLSFIHIPKVPWMVADFLQVLMSKIAGYEAGGSNIEGLIARAFGKGLSVNDISQDITSDFTRFTEDTIKLSRTRVIASRHAEKDNI